MYMLSSAGWRTIVTRTYALRRYKDELSHAPLVNVHRQRLSEEVGQIVTSWGPDDFELLLTNTIPDPVEAKVDGFGSFDLE